MNCEKRSVSLWLAILIGCAVIACDSPVNGITESGPADKGALTLKIIEAGNAKIGVRENSAPFGLHWVTPTEMGTFNAAINAAIIVEENSSATQSVVNGAVTTLHNAILAFNAAKKPGQDAPLDIGALVVAINEATIVKGSAVVSVVDGNDVAQGSYWVTSAVMGDFEAAIMLAELARDSATVQAIVNSAATTLSSAINTFSSARQWGTQSAEFSAEQLLALIGRANTAKLGVLISVDNGDDISPANRWVEASYLTNLDSAIDAAENADEGNRDTLYLALADALTDFNGAVQTGNNPDTAKASLIAAIQSADAEKAGVLTAPDADSAPLGSSWATAAQWAPFNTAYDAAVAALNNSNASVTMVNTAITNLISATSTFAAAVHNNGPGTYTEPEPGTSTVTITGLTGYSNGTDIAMGLFVSLDDLDFVSQPDVLGNGSIQNQAVTVDLYGEHYIPWAGSGSWYVGFMLEPVENALGFEIWTSNTPHNFDSNPNPTIPFSQFTKMTVFSITLDKLVAMWGEDPQVFFSTSRTMDDFVDFLTGGATYDEIRDEEGMHFWKDTHKINEFTGSDPVSAATKIYVDFPFWMMMGGRPDRGEKIGEITGTITLNNIPNGARVYISTSGNASGSHFWWWSDSAMINGISGSSASNITWVIPIYEDDLRKGFDPDADWNCTFRLYVELSGSRGYEIFIPGTRIINLANASNNIVNVGNLGSVSLAYVILSGTINITYNGNTVSELDLSVSPVEGGNSFGWTNIRPTGANASWEMLISPSDTARDAKVWIRGYLSEGGGGPGAPKAMKQLFEIDIPIGEIPANQGRTGINLNIGNIAHNTVRVLNNPEGTYTVYVTNRYISGWDYFDIVEGDYRGKGTGSGATIPITWEGEPGNGWCRVLIVTENEIRYRNNDISFNNGIGFIDWNEMTVMGAMLIISDIQYDMYDAFVFNNDTDLSSVTAITNAINASNYLAMSGNYSYRDSNKIFYLSNDWTDSGSFPVIVVDHWGSDTDPSRPRYRLATVDFAGGTGTADSSVFEPVVDIYVYVIIHFNNSPEDIVITPGNTDFTFAVADAADYRNFRWLLNGVEQSETSGTITLNISGVTIGPHRLMVMATKGETIYSREIMFRIDG